MARLTEKHISLLSLTCVMFLTSCFKSSVLAPEPSALDLDDVPPACVGIKTLEVSSGPTLTVTWNQSSDNVSEASKITYRLFMKSSSESYDLVSPDKIVVGATSGLIESGLQTGRTYTLFVQCQDEAGNVFPSGPQNEKSISIADSLAPSQITDLNAGSPTFTTILLTWSPSDDGAGGTTASDMRYRVYASLSSGFTPNNSNLIGTVTGTTSKLHSGLDPDTRWYYKVIAVDETGNTSSESNEATNITDEDTTPPTFPSNLSAIQATTTTASTISLSWTAATDDVTSGGNIEYEIYRCDADVLSTCVPFDEGAPHASQTGTTTYVDTGLAVSKKYNYAVRAVDSTGNESTNPDSDKVVTSTLFGSTGSLYAYSSLREVNTRFGAAVAFANIYGATSGAGAYDDLLVGAPNAASKQGTSSYTYAGCVFVFEGLGSGLFSEEPVGKICGTANGTLDGANFGWAISTGNFNGDGLDDFVISNPLLNSVYVFYGEASGGVAAIPDFSDATTITTATGAGTFGLGLCTGNFDNDANTRDDVVVMQGSGNGGEACAANACGRIKIYPLSGSGATATIGAPTILNPTTYLSGVTYNNNEQLARSCAVGNFNPSATSDYHLVVGSGVAEDGGTDTNHGLVYFLRKTGALTFSASASIATVNGNAISTELGSGSYFGEKLVAVQMDDDEHELVVGSPYNQQASGPSGGAVFQYTMGTSFNLVTMGTALPGGNDQDNNGTGQGLAALDEDADGVTDYVAVGAFLDDLTSIYLQNNINIGQVYVHANTGTSFSSGAQNIDFDYSGEDASTNQFYGDCVASGDLNNDTIPDVVIGSPGQDFQADGSYNLNADMGAAFVYFGKAAGEIDFTQPDQVLYQPSSRINSGFGASCAIGDYDGDDIDDLLVGAPYFDPPSGGTNRGIVYVFKGQDGGDVGNAGSPNGGTIEIPTGQGQDQMFFGAQLAFGDWDGSGKPDLAVAAPGKTTGAGTNAGRVYMYFAASASPKAISTASYTIFDSPQTENTQRFGSALAAFRTTNGAGSTTDLIACSPLRDLGAGYYASAAAARTDVGKCFVFQGSTTHATVNTTVDSYIPFPQHLANSSTGNTVLFGTAAGTGDWNDDSVEDLVICAAGHPSYPDAAVTSTGVCFAYFGSSDNLGGFNQPTSAYVANGGAPDAGNLPQADDKYSDPMTTQTGAVHFGGGGYDVAITGTNFSAGNVVLSDINNNGRDDLLVGAALSDAVGGPDGKGYRSGRVLINRGDFD